MFKPRTEFHKFLANNDKKWLIEYVNQDGSVRADKVTLHLQGVGGELQPYGSVANLTLAVRELYGQYVRWELPDTNIPKDDLETILNYLPSGVAVRRIKQKNSLHNWSVNYRNGRRYFGKTIEESISKLLKSNKSLRLEYILAERESQLEGE